MTSNIPFQRSRACSRPAGNWVMIEDHLFRPAQYCIPRYGAGISMMEVSLSEQSIQENNVFRIFPTSKRYSRGTHTINFYDGLCVIDGFGYLYPFLGTLLASIRRFKRRAISKSIRNYKEIDEE